MHMARAAWPKVRPIVMPAPTISAGTQHTPPDQMKAMLSQLLRSSARTSPRPEVSIVFFAIFLSLPLCRYC